MRQKLCACRQQASLESVDTNDLTSSHFWVVSHVSIERAEGISIQWTRERHDESFARCFSREIRAGVYFRCRSTSTGTEVLTREVVWRSQENRPKPDDRNERCIIH